MAAVALVETSAIQRWTLDADGQFTPWVSFRGTYFHRFQAIVEGTFTGKGVVQVRFPGGAAISLTDVAFDDATPGVRIAELYGNFDVRLGVDVVGASNTPTVTLMKGGIH